METVSDGGFGPGIPDDPSELTPRRAAQMFLESKAVDVTEKTVRDYRDRLSHFLAWCEESKIERVSQFSGLAFDQYRAHRAKEVAPTTLKGHMVAVNQLVKYLVRIDAVPESLEEAVDIPRVSAEDETSDTLLEAEDAKALLNFYRNDPGSYGTAKHTLLELAWNTGARVGGLRGLDLNDYESLDEGGVLEFTHRPDSDTPLKNRTRGERVVRVSEKVCDVLDHYLVRDRVKKRDEYGRDPLLSCRQGRPSIGTLRAWCYLVSQPCAYTACPHGKERETCQYRKRNHGSKCPSSRSPHQVRSGSITWQLDKGIPLEHVSERVNASADVISRFYDKAATREKMLRREQYTAGLDVEDEEEQ